MYGQDWPNQLTNRRLQMEATKEEVTPANGVVWCDFGTAQIVIKSDTPTGQREFFHSRDNGRPCTGMASVFLAELLGNPIAVAICRRCGTWATL